MTTTANDTKEQSMDLKGRKLVAVYPARYYQYAENLITRELLTGPIRTIGPSAYWMRVLHVDQTTLTYDSFVQKKDGVIKQVSDNRVCHLENIMAEISCGLLTVE
jgi:hypothetical protein